MRMAVQGFARVETFRVGVSGVGFRGYHRYSRPFVPRSVELRCPPFTVLSRKGSLVLKSLVQG